LGDDELSSGTGARGERGEHSGIVGVEEQRAAMPGAGNRLAAHHAERRVHAQTRLLAAAALELDGIARRIWPARVESDNAAAGARRPTSIESSEVVLRERSSDQVGSDEALSFDAGRDPFAKQARSEYRSLAVPRE